MLAIIRDILVIVVSAYAIRKTQLEIKKLHRELDGEKQKKKRPS